LPHLPAAGRATAAVGSFFILDDKEANNQGCRILASDNTLIVFNPQNEPLRFATSTPPFC